MSVLLPPWGAGAGLPGSRPSVVAALSARRLCWAGGSRQPQSPRVRLQGLSLVLSEGSLRDGEEKEPPLEEDSGDADALQGYQWLLRDLPRLPLFESVRSTTALALQQVRAGARHRWAGPSYGAGQGAGPRARAGAIPAASTCSHGPPLQAIHMETDPQTISAYLVYLSQHTPVEEQGQHSDLALVRGRGWGSL